MKLKVYKTVVRPALLYGDRHDKSGSERGQHDKQGSMDGGIRSSAIPATSDNGTSHGRSRIIY